LLIADNCGLPEKDVIVEIQNVVVIEAIARLPNNEPPMIS